jgi:hypothetical protein
MAAALPSCFLIAILFFQVMPRGDKRSRAVGIFPKPRKGRGGRFGRGGGARQPTAIDNYIISTAEAAAEAARRKEERVSYETCHG